MSHVWLINDKLFEFGPLLIGKNPEEKDKEEIKGINSSTFKITNNGRFENEVSFYFASDVLDEEDEGFEGMKKGIFFLEPQEMKLGLDRT